MPRRTPRTAKPRPAFALSRALLAFAAAAVLAVGAAVALLWPDIATKAADGLSQAPRQREQWLPAGLFE